MVIAFISFSAAIRLDPIKMPCLFLVMGMRLIPVEEIINSLTSFEWSIPLDFMTYMLLLRSPSNSRSSTMIQVSTIDEIPSSLGFWEMEPIVIAAENMTVICFVFK